MNINKVHCLFEQSGTFKNEFIKLGIAAEDYDIQNEFGQTDHVIDLFGEIRGGYNGEPSIFDGIEKDDLIIAFFPCVRFEEQIRLGFRGDLSQQKNWDDLKKLQYDIELHEFLAELYNLVTYLTIMCIRKGLRLVIENPYSEHHYLKTFWCIRPKIIDRDRSRRGDYFKKPTQYWFINCEPETKLLGCEDCNFLGDIYSTKLEGIGEKTKRSMIHPQYANRFIREFILGEEFEQQEEQIMMI